MNKEESKNDEEIERRNYKEPMVKVKNVTFGIQTIKELYKYIPVYAKKQNRNIFIMN